MEEVVSSIPTNMHRLEPLCKCPAIRTAVKCCQRPPDVTQRLREERAFQKKPAGGYVPDATTAVRIADAVLIPTYGVKRIGY
jgi:hypothetical protein